LAQAVPTDERAGHGALLADVPTCLRQNGATTASSDYRMCKCSAESDAS